MQPKFSYKYVPIKVPYIQYDEEKDVHPAVFRLKFTNVGCSADSRYYKFNIDNCVYMLTQDSSFRDNDVRVLLPLIVFSGCNGSNVWERVFITPSLEQFIYETYLYKYIIPGVNGHGDPTFSNVHPICQLLGCTPNDLRWSLDVEYMRHYFNTYLSTGEIDSDAPYQSPIIRLVIHAEEDTDTSVVIDKDLPSDNCIEIRYVSDMNEYTGWSADLVSNPRFNPELPF